VLFFQRSQGLTQLETGLRLLPEMGAFVVASALTGRLVRRIRFTVPLAAGLAVAGLASVALLAAGATSRYVGLGLALGAFGAGLGFVVAASTAAAVTSVGPEHAPMASGLVNTFRQVGAVLGTAVLGTILTSRAAAALPGALAAHGVSGVEQRSVLAAFAQGSLRGQSVPVPVRAALGDALTSGLHAGLVVNAVVFLVAAVVSAVVVRHRNHTERPVTQEAAEPVSSR
jgi:predicted MFS family arabinose efflux permease